MKPARTLSILLWLVTALPVTLLGMRFGMRALGVRPDIPLPGLVYSLTAPLVGPFYTFFPASARFDYRAVEVASLVAAGCAVGVAVAVYALGLLLFGLLMRKQADRV